MDAPLKIAPDLRARVDDIAARSSLSAADVVADALVNGHSLAWQEHFLYRVAAGIAAAESGDFATDDEVDRVLHKYRPG